MAEQSERRRILDMLAAGQINAAEAEELLASLGAAPASGGPDERAQIAAAALKSREKDREARRQIARSLRVVIDAGEGEEERKRVAVTLPVALAKFAGKLIPEDLRIRLEDQGIDLADLLQALDHDLPAGRLVDIDAAPGEGESRARIIVEVV